MLLFVCKIRFWYKMGAISVLLDSGFCSNGAFFDLLEAFEGCGFTVVFILCVLFVTCLSLHISNFTEFVVQSPLYRRLWGPVRGLEYLHPDANPRRYYAG